MHIFENIRNFSVDIYIHVHVYDLPQKTCSLCTTNTMYDSLLHHLKYIRLDHMQFLQTPPYYTKGTSRTKIRPSHIKIMVFRPLIWTVERLY